MYGSVVTPPQPAINPFASQLQGWFASVDTDRSGHVTAPELLRALQMAGLNFSLALCQQMIRIHDRDFSGTIDFHEFSQLHAFIVKVQNSFQYYDRDYSNSLSMNEVYEALTHAGFRLERPSFERLFRTFDPDSNHQLSKAEFVAMTVFLQSCSLTFQAFDSTRTGHVQLDFSQFVYAAANTR